MRRWDKQYLPQENNHGYNHREKENDSIYDVEDESLLSRDNAPLFPNDASKRQKRDRFADENQRHRLRVSQGIAQTHQRHLHGVK